MSISELHENLWGSILSYANAQELGRITSTNKALQGVVYTKIHTSLWALYGKEPALHSYVVALKEQPRPIALLFQRIIQDVKNIGGGKERLTSMGWPAVSMSRTPTVLAEWIREQQAKSLLALFRNAVEGPPALQPYLAGLTGTEIEQSDALCTWLNAHTDLLQGVERIWQHDPPRILTTFPEQVFLLTKLKVLRIGDNQLQVLPDSLGNLTQLEELVLPGNQLQVLPDSLGNLINLQALQLDRNQLRVLPDSLGKLTKLRTLCLSNNRLQALPHTFSKLTQLKTLYLFGNQLQTLPDSFGNLTQLQTLDLRFNQLQTLPDSFGKLTQLFAVAFEENPIRFVSKALKTSSVKAIRENPIIMAAEEPPALWKQLAEEICSWLSWVAEKIYLLCIKFKSIIS